MDEASLPRPTETDRDDPLAYPTDRVIGSVEQTTLAAVVSDLIDAGFAPIGILAGEAGLRRLSATAGERGMGGLLRRVAKSAGGDLDHIRRAEQEVRAGNALVDVEVDGDEEKERARDILLRHGGTFITHLGPWAIETLA